MKKHFLIALALLGGLASANAQNGNVGIGTNNPQAKLDINGNLIIRSTQKVNNNGVSALVVDNATGEVKVAGTTGNNTPMNYAEYVISNVNGDWLADYDTKIPVTDYVVSIVGSSFVNPIGASGTFLVPGSAGPANSYNPLNVAAFQSGGTWHLRADYVGGAPNGYNGTWRINVLIVNKSFVKIITPATSDLGGSNTGSAATAPAGL